MSLAFAGILLAALIAQALWPGARLRVVVSGAALSCLLASLRGVSTTARLFAAVPWDVLTILVGLGVVTEVLVASRVFSLMAVRVTRATGARPWRFALTFALVMYVVSGLVNNLTALLLVLPVMLVVFRVLGVTQRFLSLTLGLLLVACNLGGAATPIGDFPAILLLGRGAMRFGVYLTAAAPRTALALALVVVALSWRRQASPRDGTEALRAALTVNTLEALHRGIRIDRRYLLPGAAALAAMLLGWVLIPASTGIGPELICWLGAALSLLGAGKVGETIARRRVDVEAVLFLLSLFVMVGAARESHLFTDIARWLTALPLSPAAQVVVFLVAAALLTGVFSAGPSMAALLDVADALARQHPREARDALYVGLAMSVCAGSSLFLTAATAGPLTQSLIERAGLRGPDGEPLRFGFREYLPVGLVAFALILSVGIASTLAAL